MVLLPMNSITGNVMIHGLRDIECKKIFRLGETDNFHYLDSVERNKLVAHAVRAGLARPIHHPFPNFAADPRDPQAGGSAPRGVTPVLSHSI